MMTNNGRFIISLDYELYWGVRDLLPLAYYREHMSQEREIVPKLLELFDQNKIYSTWAVVGFMFAETFEELANGLPDLKPGYKNAKLSPYPYLASAKLGDGASEDPDHFSCDLIKAISRTKYQRVATHTFSHYYCLEEGQTREQFREDLSAAIRIAKNKNVKIESIVFPRNQCNPAYIGVLKELGIRSYRGNPSHWIHRSGYSDRDFFLKRALRLLDTYINLSGHNSFSMAAMRAIEPVNLQASHFLRPYSRKLHVLEPLRLRRILSSMTYAAKHGLIYHLWSHPYNFSRDEEKNMGAMKRIISHYHMLHRKYGMQSTNMEELSDQTLERASMGNCPH
jgi:hypothetical protein